MQPQQEKAVDQARSDSGLNVIRELGQLKTFGKNAPIFSPGDVATHLYLIAEGEVKLSRFTAEGRELGSPLPPIPAASPDAPKWCFVSPRCALRA